MMMWHMCMMMWHIHIACPTARRHLVLFFYYCKNSSKDSSKDYSAFILQEDTWCSYFIGEIYFGKYFIYFIGENIFYWCAPVLLQEDTWCSFFLLLMCMMMWHMCMMMWHIHIACPTARRRLVLFFYFIGEIYFGKYFFLQRPSPPILISRAPVLLLTWQGCCI